MPLIYIHRYTSQQMVNQMNQSKMSVVGNVMIGQKVTSPTQMSSKFINDNVISTQHLGNINVFNVRTSG
jgi:hypothetical protein